MIPPRRRSIGPNSAETSKPLPSRAELQALAAEMAKMPGQPPNAGALSLFEQHVDIIVRGGRQVNTATSPIWRPAKAV
jgi:hypothetical protein